MANIYSDRALYTSTTLLEVRLSFSDLTMVKKIISFYLCFGLLQL